jgi:hypothetical protein
VTQIWGVEVTCDECGEKVETYFLASFSSFGFSDFWQVDHVVCPNGHRIEGDFVEFTEPDDPDAAPGSRRPDEEE